MRFDDNEREKLLSGEIIERSYDIDMMDIFYQTGERCGKIGHSSWAGWCIQSYEFPQLCQLNPPYGKRGDIIDLYNHNHTLKLGVIEIDFLKLVDHHWLYTFKIVELK